MSFGISIDFQTNAKINQVEAKVVLDENQKNKKESILHIGDINISTNGNYNNQNISINNGQIKFNFNEELRKEVADMVKKELEKNGFKDVKLEISPNGDVNVSDATYVIKKGIFGKIVKNVKMKIHVNINVENNKVNINLDRLNIKNIFLEAIKNVVDGKNIAINEIEKSLESTGIDVERNSRSQITLDLNSILKKYFDNNLNLKNAQITNDGNVLIEYEYNTRK
jgi:citrate lyase gamma subunit